VTIGGETHPLPQPFFVLATQNPIEHEGTYPLPEAQLDRFELKVIVGYPGREAERDILARSLAGDAADVQPVATRDDLQRLAEAARAVDLNERLQEYIVRLLEASRAPGEHGMPELAPLVEFGASPRAGVMLAHAVRAYAYLDGRDYALPEDVKELVPDVMRHRLVLTYEAEARGVSADQIVAQLLEHVGIP
jgi:MoxR-like ATPase